MSILLKGNCSEDRFFEEESIYNELDIDIETPTNTYRFILHCIDPNQPEYTTRLLKYVINTLMPNPNENDNNQRQRLRCVLYCWKCEKDDSKDEGNHSREGETMIKLCVTCQIPIRKGCDDIFHNEKHLALSVCMTGNISSNQRVRARKTGICILDELKEK